MTDIFSTLQEIKKHCKNNMCSNCIFWIKNHCMFCSEINEGQLPKKWELLTVANQILDPENN